MLGGKQASYFCKPSPSILEAHSSVTTLDGSENSFEWSQVLWWVVWSFPHTFEAISLCYWQFANIEIKFSFECVSSVSAELISRNGISDEKAFPTLLFFSFARSHFSLAKRQRGKKHFQLRIDFSLNGSHFSDFEENYHSQKEVVAFMSCRFLKLFAASLHTHRIQHTSTRSSWAIVVASLTQHNEPELSSWVSPCCVLFCLFVEVFIEEV